MKIRLIEKVTTFPNINKKAEELSQFCRRYEGCLLAKEGDYNDFRKLISTAVALTNQRYPRTKPFEVYNDGAKTNYIYVCVKGNSDQSVVRMFFSTVKGAYHKQQNAPIESISYALKEEEVQL